LGFGGGLPIHPFLQGAPLAITLRVTLLFALAMSAVAGLRWVRDRDAEPHVAQVFLLAWVSLWMTVFSSLSWPLMIIMALPGAPFLAASALNAAPRGWAARLWRPAIGLALLGGMAFFAQAKLRQPFQWSGWREPSVAEATEESALPLLRGLRLSPQTREFVETVAKALQEDSGPADPVFVYPHMPLFYLLADRKPAAFAPVHFFDVCPDYLAREDAARLRANPPAVIVDFRHTEAEIEDAEQIFRSGGRSGQRDIMAAIDDLTRDGYELVEDLRTPRTDHPVRVWRRTRQ
jgi:hypothetical protein